MRMSHSKSPRLAQCVHTHTQTAIHNVVTMTTRKRPKKQIQHRGKVSQHHSIVFQSLLTVVEEEEERRV